MKGKKETEEKKEGALFKAEPALKKMKGYAMFAAVGWTILLSGLLAWDIVSVHRNTEELAINEARANFNKDQAFRYWGGSHGGVYVPVDENTPPSPYLKHIPERDITTPSGKKLTLMNPAYMVRQMNEFFTKEYGVVGHITSLKLHNPDNVPDDWERKALEAFENGEKEVLEFSDISGAPYIRLMQPMMTQKGCLKCHAYQGYKVGDVRGGVSVSLSISDLLAQRNEKILMQGLSHCLIWLLGLIGIFIGYGKIRRYFLERTDAEKNQREAEERATALLNATLESLILIDLEGKVLAVNSTGASRLNTTQEHLVGKNVFSFMSPEVVETRRKMISEILTTRKGVTLEDHRENRDFHTNFVPVQNGGVHAIAMFSQDITERKLADMAIRESEEKYRRLVENLREEYFFYSHGMDGVFIYVSPSIKGVLGYSPEEFLGHYTEYLTDNPINEEAVKYTEQSLKGEQQPPYELEIYHKDRTVHVLEIAEIPVLDDEGEVIALEGIAHDITERKQMEDALYFISQRGWKEEGEGFFKSLATYLAETLKVDYAFIDKLKDEETAQTVALYSMGDITENIEYRLQYTPCEKVIGKVMCCYPRDIQKIFPKDELLVRMEAESYIGIPLWDSKGEPIGLIAVMGRKPMTQPKLATSLLQVVAVRAAHELERIRADRDLHRSEDMLKEAQQIAQVGHWELDLMTSDLVWSDEIYRIFDVDKEKFDASYKAFIAAIHPDDRELVNMAYTQSRERHEPYDIDHRLLMKDGTVKYVKEKCRTEYDDKGQPLRSIGTVQDITAAKETEMELERAKDAAEAASLAKTDFLSRMSHELRTPLNSILGFAQVIQSDGDKVSEKQQLCVEEITSAGWHLTDLVNEVLDISRVESGNLSLKVEPVDICPVMEECINLMTPLAEERNIKISCNLKVCNKETVLGDKTRLKEVFLNLLSNAVKYNVESGTVTISCDKRGKKRLLISIVDSGKGISEEDRNLLFIPFGRIKGEDPAIQGTGIGLAISKHLVELMDGEIGVETAPGKGSTFWVKLQIAEDAPS